MSQDNFSLLNANLDDSLRPLFANKIFLASIGLFFALYAGWLAPKLPNSVIYFFDTIPGKLLFIFIIAFVASRRVENSFQVALVVSVMFLVTLTVLNKIKMQEAFQNLSMEHFNLMGTMQNIMQEQQQDKEGMEGSSDSFSNNSGPPPSNNSNNSGPPPSDNSNNSGPPPSGGIGQVCKENNICDQGECKDGKCVESSSSGTPSAAKMENFEAFSNYNNYANY